MTLLYIDDDRDDRDLLVEIAETTFPEVKVELAANGPEGLTFLQSKGSDPQMLPCVIILDLNMPGWDGRFTFERLREVPVLQKIPVAILTTSGNPSDRIFFDQQPNVSFFIKSDRVADLKKTISDILQKCA